MTTLTKINPVQIIRDAIRRNHDDKTNLSNEAIADEVLRRIPPAEYKAALHKLVTQRISADSTAMFRSDTSTFVNQTATTPAVKGGTYQPPATTFVPVTPTTPHTIAPTHSRKRSLILAHVELLNDSIPVDGVRIRVGDLTAKDLRWLSWDRKRISRAYLNRSDQFEKAAQILDKHGYTTVDQLALTEAQDLFAAIK